MKKLNYINGNKSNGSGNLTQVYNPANSQLICEYNVSKKSDVEQAVAIAKKSLSVWKNYSIEKRAEILVKAADIMIEKQSNPGELCETEIMHLIIDEMGKSVYEAETEVFESSDILRYFGTEACQFIKDDFPTLDKILWPTKESVLRYQPVGVVGIIKAWNYPLEIPIWSIGAALLCGNTIVFKPSEYSPLIGVWLGQLFKQAGLPDGVFNVVAGDKTTGEFLVESQIDMISFTGSSITGRKIAKKCAERNIKFTLEMGGKDPAIVCDDANMERSVNGIVWGAFANAGQVCVSAERIYVHSKIYDEFVEKVIKLTKSLVVGDGWNPKTDITTMVSEEQLKKVDSQIKDAINKGAKVLTGGKRLTGELYDKGFYYAPTVVVDVNETMEIFTEETFGPVIAIQKFLNYEEVIKKANSSNYGLGASIWSESRELADGLANCLEAGMVWINDINLCFPQCPWAGIKMSGVGYDLSKHGIYEYCRIKHLNFELDLQPSQPWWYPYNK